MRIEKLIAILEAEEKRRPLLTIKVSGLLLADSFVDVRPYLRDAFAKRMTQSMDAMITGKGIKRPVGRVFGKSPVAVARATVLKIRHKQKRRKP